MQSISQVAGGIATDGVKVTASDSADFPACNGLNVGTAGNARIIFADGRDTGGTDLYPLQAGYNPISVKRIYSTGITAANIWALY